MNEGKKKQSRKRSRNPTEWKREKRKRLRIAGKSYVNSRGDVVNERKIGADCKCRRQCYIRVPEDQRNTLFDGYYSLKSHDEQNAYLFGLIRKHDIARKRCKESDKRTCSYKYYVRIPGKEVQICRLAFAHIHGISPHKIRILCQKQDQNIMFPRDGRGKHGNRPRKIPEDILSQIKNHINSIITSDRVFDFFKEERHNGPDVNITKMWKDFLEKYDAHYNEVCEGNEEIAISKDSSRTDNCPLVSNSEICDNPSPFSTITDVPEYPIVSVAEHLGIMDQLSEGQLRNNADTEVCGKPNKQKHKQVPIVKHWLYSKVFHEEFKINDFSCLKKKLCQLKDVTKSTSGTHINKPERKQRSPKKITRQKDNSEPMNMFESLSSESAIPSIVDTPAVDLQNVNSDEGTDVYILPDNVQDVNQFPTGSDESFPSQSPMHFNLHTFSSQNSILSPLVNVSPTQNIQCSSVVSLPAGSINFTQNSCGFMNLNMAAFY